MYLFDDKSVIDAPDYPVVLDSYDGLFSSLINPNAALCVAFLEPRQVSHKSALLSSA